MRHHTQVTSSSKPFPDHPSVKRLPYPSPFFKSLHHCFFVSLRFLLVFLSYSVDFDYITFVLMSFVSVSFFVFSVFDRFLKFFTCSLWLSFLINVSLCMALVFFDILRSRFFNFPTSGFFIIIILISFKHLLVSSFYVYLIALVI